jgi:hypothetical protein
MNLFPQWLLFFFIVFSFSLRADILPQKKVKGKVYRVLKGHYVLKARSPAGNMFKLRVEKSKVKKKKGQKNILIGDDLVVTYPSNLKKKLLKKRHFPKLSKKHFKKLPRKALLKFGRAMAEFMGLQKKLSPGRKVKKRRRPASKKSTWFSPDWFFKNINITIGFNTAYTQTNHDYITRAGWLAEEKSGSGKVSTAYADSAAGFENEFQYESCTLRNGNEGLSCPSYLVGTSAEFQTYIGGLGNPPESKAYQEKLSGSEGDFDNEWGDYTRINMPGKAIEMAGLESDKEGSLFVYTDDQVVNDKKLCIDGYYKPGEESYWLNPSKDNSFGCAALLLYDYPKYMSHLLTNGNGSLNEERLNKWLKLYELMQNMCDEEEDNPYTKEDKQLEYACGTLYASLKDLLINFSGDDTREAISSAMETGAVCVPMNESGQIDKKMATTSQICHGTCFF